MFLDSCMGFVYRKGLQRKQRDKRRGSGFRLIAPWPTEEAYVQRVLKSLILRENVSFSRILHNLRFISLQPISDVEARLLSDFRVALYKKTIIYLHLRGLFAFRRIPHCTTRQCLPMNMECPPEYSIHLRGPIRRYSTKELFANMNKPDSKFLGIKTVPLRLPNILCNVVRI